MNNEGIRANPVVKHVVNYFKRSKEKFKNIPKEGYVINTSLALGGYGLWALQALLHPKVHELLQVVPSDQLYILGLGSIALSNLLTFGISALTLQKKGWCSDGHTTAPYVALHNPWLASAVGTGVRMAYLFPNPNNAFGFLEIMQGQGPNDLYENLAYQGVVEFLYFNIVNLMIHTGHSKHLTRVMEWMGNKVRSGTIFAYNKIKEIQKRE